MMSYVVWQVSERRETYSRQRLDLIPGPGGQLFRLELESFALKSESDRVAPRTRHPDVRMGGLQASASSMSFWYLLGEERKTTHVSDLHPDDQRLLLGRQSLKHGPSADERRCSERYGELVSGAVVVFASLKRGGGQSRSRWMLTRRRQGTHIAQSASLPSELEARRAW